MKISEAQALIQKAFIGKQDMEHWADLGCGSGTFTYALANCLQPGSHIDAIDAKMPVLASLNNVDILCRQADMEHINLSAAALDGILMANSFHYVKDKSRLVQRLKFSLKDDGMFLIVEYDTAIANRWVPYPHPFEELKLLFTNNGFDQIDKIGERSSVFGPQKMYACVIKNS
jgi:ubiquinone/menaquinone biosynthesis C-methylase UbiE